MSPRQNVIRLLIVDDHPLVRAGLRAMIAGEPDIEVVGEAAHGEEALELQKRVRFDLALVDLRLPGIDGLETLRRLRAVNAHCRALIISTFDSEEDVFQAIQAGAKGYLLKDVPGQELIDAIHVIAEGGSYVPAWAAQRIAERNERPDLSSRELEVLALIAKGLDNKEIASVLEVSRNTVKTHVKRVFAKLDVADRTEAATAAITRGILQNSP